MNNNKNYELIKNFIEFAIECTENDIYYDDEEYVYKYFYNYYKGDDSDKFYNDTEGEELEFSDFFFEIMYDEIEYIIDKYLSFINYLYIIKRLDLIDKFLDSAFKKEIIEKMDECLVLEKLS